MNICRKLLPLKCLWNENILQSLQAHAILHANRAPFTRYSFRACNAMTGFCFGSCTVVVMSAVSADVMEHFYALWHGGCYILGLRNVLVMVFFFSSGVLWFPSLSGVFLYMWCVANCFSSLPSCRVRLYSELLVLVLHLCFYVFVLLCFFERCFLFLCIQRPKIPSALESHAEIPCRSRCYSQTTSICVESTFSSWTLCALLN